jgi:WD40 repeat protein
LCRLEWWDLKQDQPLLLTKNLADEQRLDGIAITSDGSFAIAYGNKSVQSWNLTAAKLEREWPVKQDAMQQGVIVTPDQRYFARYCGGEIRSRTGALIFQATNTVIDIHEIRTGQLVQHLELKKDWREPSQQARPVALHLEAGWLIAKDEKNELQLWSLKTGQLWASLAAHDGAPFSASFSQDGRSLVTAGPGVLRLWPLPLIEQEVLELQKQVR